MNRGNIPGYYYDEEKRKYFKIQANHVGSSEAKHTKANVNREQRESKKRKIHDREDARRRQQTVRPSRILAVGNMALSRELGLSKPSDISRRRDAFFVSQLRPSIVFAGNLPLTIPHLTEKLGHLLVTVAQSPSCYSVYQIRPRCGKLAVFDGWERCEGGVHGPPLYMRLDFDNPVISIVSGRQSYGHKRPLVICAQQTRSTLGDVMFTSLSHDLDDHDDDHYSPSIRLSLSGPEGSLWASSMHPATNDTAIAGTDAVHVLDAAANITGKFKLRGESRAVAWLDTNTVVFGQPFRDGPEVPTASIHLWDIRSSGTALRFRLPKSKHSRVITGILRPDDSAPHILASDNSGFSLYDTRMNRDPSLSFTHVHEGPQLQLTAYQQHTVAAVDVENQIQFYSLRDGKHMGTKRSPLPGRAPISGLGFCESILLACQNNHLLRWTYGSSDEVD